MKNLNEWFAGGLYKNVGARYRYHPRTKEELINNINEIVAGGDINLNQIDTSRINDMSCLFTWTDGVAVSDQVLERINDLEFGEWDTSHVTDMSYMFQGCDKMIDPDLSRWDTSRVWGITYMFEGCTSFVGHSIENWNTSSISSAMETFHGCTSFNPDLSHWDVSSLTYGSGMFQGCTKFVGTGLGSWRPARLSAVGRMFKDCKSLEVDLSGWDTVLDDDPHNYNARGGVFPGATRMGRKSEYIPRKLKFLK